MLADDPGNTDVVKESENDENCQEAMLPKVAFFQSTIVVEYIIRAIIIE